MKNRKSAKVIPICPRNQKMVRADQEELGQSEVLTEHERLRQMIEKFITYLKCDQGHGSFGALSPAVIRHQQAVLAGFLLWVQGNLREGD